MYFGLTIFYDNRKGKNFKYIPNTPRAGVFF
jgi:hypothetical protein